MQGPGCRSILCKFCARKQFEEYRQDQKVNDKVKEEQVDALKNELSVERTKVVQLQAKLETQHDKNAELLKTADLQQQGAEQQRELNKQYSAKNKDLEW